MSNTSDQRTQNQPQHQQSHDDQSKGGQTSQQGRKDDMSKTNQGSNQGSDDRSKNQPSRGQQPSHSGVNR
jgi:hypothetical protein